MVLSIGVLILIGIVTQSFFSGTDYSTYGAVTYFDDSGHIHVLQLQVPQPMSNRRWNPKAAVHGSPDRNDRSVFHLLSSPVHHKSLPS